MGETGKSSVLWERALGHNGVLLQATGCHGTELLLEWGPHGNTPLMKGKQNPYLKPFPSRRGTSAASPGPQHPWALLHKPGSILSATGHSKTSTTYSPSQHHLPSQVFWHWQGFPLQWSCQAGWSQAISCFSDC